MTAPTYFTSADYEALYSAKELQQVATHGVSVSAVLSAVNERVHGFLAPLIGPAVLVTVPASVKWAAGAMARYSLHTSSEKERLTKDYDDAIAWLRAVSLGEENLILDLADDPETEEDETASRSVWSESGSLHPASEWDALYRGASFNPDRLL